MLEGMTRGVLLQSPDDVSSCRPGPSRELSHFVGISSLLPCPVRVLAMLCHPFSSFPRHTETEMVTEVRARRQHCNTPCRSTSPSVYYKQQSYAWSRSVCERSTRACARSTTALALGELHGESKPTLEEKVQFDCFLL